MRHVCSTNAFSLPQNPYVAESVCVHQIKRYVCLALLYTEQIPPALFRLETKPRNHANGVVSLVFPRYSQVMRTPPPPPPGISSHPICTPSRGLTAHIASLINFACLFPYFVRLAIFTLSLVHTPSLYPHCRPVRAPLRRGSWIYVDAKASVWDWRGLRLGNIWTESHRDAKDLMREVSCGPQNLKVRKK